MSTARRIAMRWTDCSSGMANSHSIRNPHESRIGLSKWDNMARKRTRTDEGGKRSLKRLTHANTRMNIDFYPMINCGVQSGLAILAPPYPHRRKDPLVETISYQSFYGLKRVRSGTQICVIWKIRCAYAPFRFEHI